MKKDSRNSRTTDQFQRLDNSPNVKYSTILWRAQDLKVGKTNSIPVVKNSVLHTVMTSRLLVCLAVISLTAFSHGIFKHKTIVSKIFYVKMSPQTMLHFLCSCSYLFAFLLSSQFYWHVCLTSTLAYFFDPPCIRRLITPHRSISLPIIISPPALCEAHSGGGLVFCWCFGDFY